MSEPANVIEMRGITKQFGSFKANDNINLTVKKGEVHALLGENGAGKSTLMNILSGLLEPTTGEIFVNGKKAHITSPNMASKLGIGMVHQHFMLVDKFTIAENIVLGTENTKFGFLEQRKSQREIKELSEHYGLFVDPSAKVESVSVGMEQRAEILKTLYRGNDILILDEPTAVLTPQEITELMGILRSLTKEGKSIIIITHKIEEIMQVADRCTVIRRGKSVDTVDVKNSSRQELADMMVGRSVSFKVDKKTAEPKQPVLTIKNLTVKESRGIEAVKDLSLEVRSGEILGIAGIDGNGQSELIYAITGLSKVESGTITLDGKEIQNLTPRNITESGLGHIPEDRHKFGLILPMSLYENMALQTYYKKPFSKNGFLNKDAMQKNARHLIKEYDVRTQSENNPAESLSGGNQQKAIIAREISRDPNFLIAAQPTRGLDVGAIEYIHKRLVEQRDNGKAVLLMSFEMDEIMNVSDRILVMYGGKVAGIVDPKEVTEQELGLLMAGSSLEKAKDSGNQRGKESAHVK